jgi:hypothetical protein
LAQRYELKDVTIAEPALEAIIRGIYQHGLDGLDGLAGGKTATTLQGVEAAT